MPTFEIIKFKNIPPIWFNLRNRILWFLFLVINTVSHIACLLNFWYIYISRPLLLLTQWLCFLPVGHLVRVLSIGGLKFWKSGIANWLGVYTGHWLSTVYVYLLDIPVHITHFTLFRYNDPVCYIFLICCWNDKFAHIYKL